MSPAELLLWAGGSVVVLSAALAARRRVQKGSAFARWRRLLYEVSQTMGGRVSAPHPSEAPQLRAEIAGRTVTLTLANFTADPARIRADAQVALPEGGNLVRLYVGWDAVDAPPDFAHVPVQIVTVPPGLDGRLQIHAEDPTVGERFLAQTAVDLLDVRRETEARALEVRVRGGYLTLSTDGTRPTAPMLERTLRAAHRLSDAVQTASRRSSREDDDPSRA